MIWVKAFHLIFMVAWFAGIFYLPRIFVNLAMNDNPEVQAHLKIMAQKLYRFITPWMVLTLFFGFWLLFSYGTQAFGSTWWLKIKLLLVVALVAYHFYCGKVLKTFLAGQNKRSHVWYRWFNELPVAVLFAIIILAVVKPF